MRAFWLSVLVISLCLSVGLVSAQELGPSNVVVLVNRDAVNVRLFPALGSEVLGFVNSGFTARVYARSPDNEWVRIRFAEDEGWIGLAVLNILEGDLNTVRVADPRSIPYGGFESPRAGLTSADSPLRGRLESTGLRLRAGPSRAYTFLVNVPRGSEVPLLGRTFNNAWFQINYQGTLGWVAARFVTLTEPFDITTLPVDGIVAESLIEQQPDGDELLATLRFLLARIELAQPSLDAIRAIWTNIAVGGESVCANFPAQPTDYIIPNPLLAANFDILDPIQRDFNDAMFNVRLAVDLFIDLCNRPQPQRGSVGQATVQGALAAINLADQQFASLRQRLNALIPPELEPGPNECLFTFADQADILDLVAQGTIYLDRFFPPDFITGYCFDAAAGQNVLIQFLRFNPNLAIFAAVSPIDNPTNFLAVQAGGGGQNLLSLGQITIPADGRYLIITTSAADRGAFAAEEAAQFALEGDFAFLIYDVLAPPPPEAAASPVDLTGGLVQAGDLTPLLPVQVITQPDIVVPTVVPGTTGGGTTGFCPGLNLTCELLTCEQAVACLQAGNFTLDPDNDRIPCEETGCTLSAN